MLKPLESVGLWAARHTKRLVASALFLSVCLTFLIASAASTHRYTITDGTATLTLSTMKTEQNDLLALADMTVGEHDRVEMDRKTRTVTVYRAFPVQVTAGTQTQTVMVTAGKVQDALAAANVVMDEDDIINLDPDAALTASAEIVITHVSYEYATEDHPIAFTVKTTYTDDLDDGKTVTKTAGANGVKQVKVLNKLVNGVVMESETVDETVVRAPVQTVQLVGTRKVTIKAAASATSSQTAPKVQTGTAATTSANVKQISTLTPAKPIELDANGRPVNYSKLITGKASAYYSPKTKTFSGKVPIVGYVAVNPKQIPLGSKLYVITPDGKRVYGYAVAEDTGGFTRLGRVIDLYLNSEAECISWGVRNVEIYVLK